MKKGVFLVCLVSLVSLVCLVCLTVPSVSYCADFGYSPVYRWNNGGKTITNPTTSDDYYHFRAFTARTLSSATMLVIGGTSVVATLKKTDATGGSVVTISDALTVNAGTEGTFLAVGGASLSQALATGERVLVDITTVTGAVTSITIDLGGTIILGAP